MSVGVNGIEIEDSVVGYCGWMEGQLDNEVASNAWTVAAASAANTLALVNASARSGDMMAGPFIHTPHD